MSKLAIGCIIMILLLIFILWKNGTFTTEYLTQSELDKLTKSSMRIDTSGYSTVFQTLNPGLNVRKLGINKTAVRLILNPDDTRFKYISVYLMPAKNIQYVSSRSVSDIKKIYASYLTHTYKMPVLQPGKLPLLTQYPVKDPDKNAGLRLQEAMSRQVEHTISNGIFPSDMLVVIAE